MPQTKLNFETSAQSETTGDQSAGEQMLLQSKLFYCCQSLQLKPQNEKLCAPQVRYEHNEYAVCECPGEVRGSSFKKFRLVAIIIR